MPLFQLLVQILKLMSNPKVKTFATVSLNCYLQIQQVELPSWLPSHSLSSCHFPSSSKRFAAPHDFHHWSSDIFSISRRAPTAPK